MGPSAAFPRQPSEDGARFILRCRTREHYGFNSSILKMEYLVRDQGNERRNHERAPGRHQCRKLVRQALAASRWHNADDVSSVHVGIADTEKRGWKSVLGEGGAPRPRDEHETYAS